AAHMQNAEFCRKLQSFPVCICRDCLVHRSVSSSGFLLRLTINLCSSFAWVVGLDTSLLSENGSACRRSGVVPMFGETLESFTATALREFALGNKSASWS